MQSLERFPFGIRRQEASSEKLPPIYYILFQEQALRGCKNLKLHPVCGIQLFANGTCA